VKEDLLVIETSWPGTTIDGDPGIVSGMPWSAELQAAGSCSTCRSVRPAAPEAFTCVELPLSPDDGRALRSVLR